MCAHVAWENRGNMPLCNTTLSRVCHSLTAPWETLPLSTFSPPPQLEWQLVATLIYWSQPSAQEFLLHNCQSACCCVILDGISMWMTQPTDAIHTDLTVCLIGLEGSFSQFAVLGGELQCIFLMHPYQTGDLGEMKHFVSSGYCPAD